MESSASTAPSLPSRGSTFGRYIVLDRLGEGGMALVYSAYDPGLDRKVAIKVLQPGVDELWGEDARARLQREAVALAKLNHPNVVAVYEVGCVGAQLFIAQELVAGGDVKSWLVARKRSARDILDVFMQAGRGLAAAHGAGLVHRDFKPANLFIGEDGRVRVGDFGVARAAGNTDELRLHDPVVRTHFRAPTAGVTEAGAILGTPAYMAPEQLRGERCDARSDQFAFCVSLHEALYGARPFDLDDLTPLAADGRGATAPLGGGAKKQQTERPALPRMLRPATKHTTVPAWVRAVLLRGLSAEPEKRYPSMDALLLALGRDPARRRRRLAAALGAVALSTLLSLLAYRSLAPPTVPLCEEGEAPLAGIWDDAQRQAARQAFAKTGLAYAPDVFASTDRVLCEFQSRWTTLHQAGCVAAQGWGEDRAKGAAQLWCLGQERERAHAVSEQLVEADAGVVQRAVNLAHGLDTLSRCGALEQLMSEAAPPADAAVRRQVEELSARLAQLNAAVDAGKYKESLPAAQELVKAAERVDHLPTLVKAQWALARLVANEDPKGAKAMMLAALESAIRGRQDDSVAGIIASLVFLTSYRLKQLEEAESWARVGQAYAERLPESDSNRINLTRARALLANKQGHYEEAVTLMTRAYEDELKALGPSHPSTGRFANSLSSVHMDASNWSEVERYLGLSIATSEKNYGPLHPWMGIARSNLASVYERTERPQEALEQCDIALTALATGYSPTHELILKAHLYRAEALLELHRDAEARAAALVARDGYAQPANEASPERAWPLNVLARLEQRAHRHDAAMHLLHDALAIYSDAFGPEHPYALEPLWLLADTEIELQRFADAERTIARGMAIARQNDTPLGTNIVEFTTKSGDLALRQEQYGRAYELYAEAEHLARERKMLPVGLARLRKSLAEAALMLPGKHDEGVQYAQQARAVFAAHTWTAEELAQVDELLAKAAAP